MIVGWCAYYFVTSCVHELPNSLSASNSTWNELQVAMITASKLDVMTCTLNAFTTCIPGSQPLARLVSRSCHPIGRSVRQQGRGYDRASEQSHCACSVAHSSLLLLLGSLSAVRIRGNHLHIHSKFR